MRRLLPFILLLLAAPVAAHPWDDAAPEDVTFHLVTADPGRNQAAAWFGHSGVLAVGPDGERYYAYRLNIEDSPLRGIKTTFTDVEFALYGRSWEGKLDEYRFQERSVRTAELLLGPNETARFIAGLEAEMEVPHTYRIVEDNCSTRLMGLLDAAFTGGLPATFDGTRPETVRDLGPEYIEHDPVQANLLYLFLGKSNDDPRTDRDAAFLPIELESMLNEGGRLGAPQTVLAYPEYADGPGHGRILAATASIGVLLAAPLVGLGVLHRRGDPAAGRWLGGLLLGTGLLLAPLSIIVTLSWSDVLAVHFQKNLNVLLLSPVILSWIPLGLSLLRGEERAWQGLELASRFQFPLALIAMAATAFGTQNMDTSLALMLPLHAAARWTFSSRAVPASSAPRPPADDAPAARDG